MLTAALRVYRWDRRTSSISSDRLDADALPKLERALTVYRSGVDRRRGEARNAARVALEGLRPDRVEPVVKLLDDAATYEWPRTARCAERRLAVFEAAAPRHPLLVQEAADEVLSAALDPAPQGHEATVAALYADYPAFHRLVGFPADYTAEALRADYDLAQAQALLYSATEVTVEARGDFKHILRYARLARLLLRLEALPAPRSRRAAGDASPAAPGYRFVLDGPNSVLRKTRAYGVDFARFLAALVRLRGWRLRAEIELRRGWRPLAFTLTAEDGLGGYRGAPPAFDSALEAAIATKFGASRDGMDARARGRRDRDR